MKKGKTYQKISISGNAKNRLGKIRIELSKRKFGKSNPTLVSWNEALNYVFNSLPSDQKKVDRSLMTFDVFIEDYRDKLPFQMIEFLEVIKPLLAKTLIGQVSIKFIKDGIEQLCRDADIHFENKVKSEMDALKKAKVVQ